MKQLSKLLLIIILLCLTLSLDSQIMLANFEDNTSGEFTINEASYNPALFSKVPDIYDNPDTEGLNSSTTCFGAINVTNAGWYKNFVEFQLKTPVTIDASNRMFSFLVYRSIQPKEMRVGFNDYEEAAEVYFDRTLTNAAWERVVIDLGTSHLNETLESIWIIFSCNWSEPTSGWGEAAYYFDDFVLSSIALPPAKVIIKPSEQYQTIDDFGASDCWTGDIVGKYWGTEQKEFIAEKLFSQEIDSNGNPKGIGLSTWRFNLGAGTSEQGDDSGLEDIRRRTECFLREDGQYDWTKQAGQMYFAEKAKEYGCQNLVLFSNSPPIYYTKNGLGYADTGETTCNLLPDKFDEFAEFMATSVNHFVNNGFNVTHISPVNEPQYDWTSGQEGSPWQNSNIKQLAIKLDNSLTSHNLNTKIALAEAASWDKLYRSSGRASNQVNEFFNPSSSNYVGDLSHIDQLVSGHSYWTFGTNSVLKSTRNSVNTAASNYDLKIYQTEWSFLDAAPSPETGFASSYEDASYMDFGLFLGKMIYCDLAFAKASSWSFWTALSTEVYSQKSRFFLIRITPSDGAGGYNPYGSLLEGGKAESTPNLWVLGNYSRFIRPGYKRVRLDGASEMNNLLGTAYISPDGSRIVSVYVNMSTKYRTIDVDFKELQGQPVTIKKYITNSIFNLKKVRANETDVEATISINPRSVISVVYDIDTEATSIHDEKMNNQVLKVFPNPVSTESGLKISITDELSEQEAELCIYNFQGKKYYQQHIKLKNGKQLSIALPNTIESGMYIVVINNDKLDYKSKLIIM